MTDTEPKRNLFQLAIKPAPKNYVWETEDMLDICYWMHMILALIFGLVWGCLQIEGAFGMVSYLAASSVIVLYYVGSFQNADLDDFGGAFAVVKDGFGNRFCFFVLCWILSYTHSYDWSGIEL